MVRKFLECDRMELIVEQIQLVSELISGGENNRDNTTKESAKIAHYHRRYHNLLKKFIESRCIIY
jgi:hypothetical protein